MLSTCRECGADEGQMNELKGRFVTDRGAEAAAARIVVDAILTMLVTDDLVDSIHTAIDLLPGMDDAIPAPRCNTGFGNSGIGHKDFDGMLGVMGAEWRKF
jgi:hypothetical protein